MFARLLLLHRLRLGSDVSMEPVLVEKRLFSHKSSACVCQTFTCRFLATLAAWENLLQIKFCKPPFVELDAIPSFNLHIQFSLTVLVKIGAVFVLI